MLKKFKIIDATILQWVAMFTMLLDHACKTIGGDIILSYIGRIAFPIFCFLIVEGYYKTSNIKKYKKRLLISALISEIPFDLMFGVFFYPLYQNVMFTLLIGLLAIESFEKNLKEKKYIKLTFLQMFFALISVFGLVDYGIYGYLTIMMFFSSKKIKYTKTIQFIGMFIIHILIQEGMQIPLNIFNQEIFFPVQGFSIFSLILIWMYNGKKGLKNKKIQTFNYLYYPLHMLILVIIKEYLIYIKF